MGSRASAIGLTFGGSMSSSTSLQEELLSAARSGDNKDIRHYLRKGADLNARGLTKRKKGIRFLDGKYDCYFCGAIRTKEYCATALQFAVVCRNLSTVKLLLSLEPRPDLSVKAACGATAYEMAKANEFTEIAQLLEDAACRRPSDCAAISAAQPAATKMKESNLDRSVDKGRAILSAADDVEEISPASSSAGRTDTLPSCGTTPPSPVPARSVPSRPVSSGVAFPRYDPALHH
eukprot:NODE_1189_length_960_cov_122.942920_g991_i0.p1 GENE.NODE_1189_length_960_cov_122.942920_g991_i0~~NODE_1189_length_960_cov_122.942920_g991_i0.p1  ORF type:complete len:241 (-),score=17.88 NODE_1189_length_960_cov_122.942920_g991_i0:236-937(-)